MTIPEKLLAAAFIAAFAIGFFFALKTGIEKSERAECLKWREHAATYPLWYSVNWQREQCEHYGLPLPR